MDSVIAKIIKQKYGYVTVQAIGKIVYLTAYGDEETYLSDMPEDTLLYVEITGDCVFVLGVEDDHGDILGFGLSEKSRGVSTLDGKDVITKIV